MYTDLCTLEQNGLNYISNVSNGKASNPNRIMHLNEYITLICDLLNFK